MEGILKIVHAQNSATKFIISADPVTFFLQARYIREKLWGQPAMETKPNAGMLKPRFASGGGSIRTVTDDNAVYRD
jgi:hypothetical protein